MRIKTKQLNNYFSLHPKIYKQVRDIAKTLPDYIKAVNRYEKEERGLIDTISQSSVKKTDENEERFLNYIQNKELVEKIEKTFILNIRPEDRQKVKKMFFGNSQDKLSIDYYDHLYIKDEINKWLYFLAIELGINTLEKNDL